MTEPATARAEHETRIRTLHARRRAAVRVRGGLCKGVVVDGRAPAVWTVGTQCETYR